MSKLTGRAYIDVPGFGRLSTNQGATLNPGGKNRSEVISDQAVEGFREALAAPEVTCTVNHRSGVSLKQLGDITNANITFETDTGSVWVVRNAWAVEPTALSGGEISVRFMGRGCDEVRA